MRRLFCAGKLKQIAILPSIGILWDDRGIMLGFMWLNFSVSVYVFKRREKK